MKEFNVYLIGVGGQGIGMLSEVLLRAADHAGHKVKGVDTHGLAQRGGIVRSRLRLGEGVHSPLIEENRADMVVALERHEALRAADTALKDSGTLIYYNAAWQPMEVRVAGAKEVDEGRLEKYCAERNIRLVRVFKPDLLDARMQNIILLAHIAKNELLPGVEKEHYRQAMDDLMSGSMLEKNTALFEAELAA